MHDLDQIAFELHLARHQTLHRIELALEHLDPIVVGGTDLEGWRFTGGILDIFARSALAMPQIEIDCATTIDDQGDITLPILGCAGIGFAAIDFINKLLGSLRAGKLKSHGSIAPYMCLTSCTLASICD